MIANEIKNAQWIKAPRCRKDAVIVFSKKFAADTGKIKKAKVTLTSRGVFVGKINGRRIGDDILAPGWTDYYSRLQVFTYDITSDINPLNRISFSVGKGWFFHNWYDIGADCIKTDEPALIAVISIVYSDGKTVNIYTDKTWSVGETNVRYNNIYNGETVDFTYIPTRTVKAKEFFYPMDILIPVEWLLLIVLVHFIV